MKVKIFISDSSEHSAEILEDKVNMWLKELPWISINRVVTTSNRLIIFYVSQVGE